MSSSNNRLTRLRRKRRAPAACSFPGAGKTGPPRQPPSLATAYAVASGELCPLCPRRPTGATVVNACRPKQ
jgi:hypothetical protein